MPPDLRCGARSRRAARVLATGLNNPRHLVFRGGTLYVAEAGKGGTRHCEPGPEGGTVCYGATGSIMRLGKHPRRIITGLPSIGDQGTGGSALGPSGIVALGGGRLAFTIGGGGTPAHRATLPASARMIGTLAVASHARAEAPAQVADLMRFEAKVDPDGQGADSDLTGLIRRRPLPDHRLRRQRPAARRRRPPDPRARDVRQPHGHQPVPAAGQRADAVGADRRGGRARRRAVRQ